MREGTKFTSVSWDRARMEGPRCADDLLQELWPVDQPE